jgi:O-antigen ligase
VKGLNAIFGAFLGLCLVKFGNPPIFEKYVTPPGNILEFFLICPWPITWAYSLLAVLALAAVGLGKFRRTAPFWLTLVPAAWVVWQCVCAAKSVAPDLSWPTVFHLAACAICFYIGLFALSRLSDPTFLLAGIIAGFLLVLASGLEQHFGGLEESRRYFRLYIYPQLQEVPPEYWKKLSSDRIFATLFYPNALAGVIVLLLPPILCRVALARERFTVAARGFLCLIIGLAAIGCLVWSGSKGGWLLLLLLGLLALLRLRFSRRSKIALVVAVLLLGLVGFGVKYAGFFRKGATSVVARFDYWRAALETAMTHPLFGTGPGTFAKPYAAIKLPESEMARLAHNDYLEQASDSGWPGFALYSFFIGVALFVSYPNRPKPRNQKQEPSDGFEEREWLVFSIWLGVLGWALQSLFEFSLYIPALGWVSLTFLGWLLGHQNAPQITERTETLTK